MTQDPSALLKSLLLPPFPLLLMVAVGFALRPVLPGLGRGLMLAGWGLLYALCTPLISAKLLMSLETDPPVSLDHARTAGAIVVLGGDFYTDSREYRGDTVGRLTLERLRYAAKLHRETDLPILVTGGRGRDIDVPLGSAMREVLQREFSVQVRWVENASRNTHENAAFSAEILHAEGVGRIALVTHAWHMPRAKAAFELARLEVIPAPMAFTAASGDWATAVLPTAAGLDASYYAIHEWVGRLWYRIAYGL